MGIFAKLTRYLGIKNVVKLTTSISDNGTYPDFCTRASLDTSFFLNFRKKNKYYGKILEHI